MVQYEVEGKNFLITGGASGLGGYYVETFLSLGAKNVAVLDIAVETGKDLVHRLNETYPGKVIFVKCDVSKEDDIAKSFDEVLANFKQIDVLINNAGIMVDSPELWRIASDVNWVIDLNILTCAPASLGWIYHLDIQQGLVSFTMKALKHMSKDEGGAGGTIINTSSTAPLTKLAYLPIYCGSKMAVLNFSQILAMPPFFEQTGVRILTMCFDATDTPLLQGFEKRAYDPKHGEALVDFMAVKVPVYQKVSSAVDAFVLMYKTGAPGSIWLSVDNKPGKDFTSVIEAAFDEFQKKIREA